MKLQIGQRLKELRHQRGITQEQLSEALGVSCQSVSRWELCVCYPDLEHLPAIANFFEVTMDDLMGMDQMRSQSRREAIFTDALTLEQREDWDRAIQALREAVRTYPSDDGLLTELSLALTRTGRAQDRAEAIALSEKVLGRCTDEKLRSTLRANLCFLYRANGQTEKAAAWGRTLPHIWESREMLLPGLLPEEVRAETTARSFNIAFQVLRDVAAGRDIAFSLGYRPEEAVDSGALLRFVQERGE